MPITTKLVEGQQAKLGQREEKPGREGGRKKWYLGNDKKEK